MFAMLLEVLQIPTTMANTSALLLHHLQPSPTKLHLLHRQLALALPNLFVPLHHHLMMQSKS